MAKFVYNNAKNTNISYTLFKLNCGYYPKMLFKNKADLHSKSCSTNKLAKELRELIEIYCQNLLHTQEL